MEYKVFTIDLKGGVTIGLRAKMYTNEEEVNIDEILRIDINNLPAEVVTSPVIMHRFGSLLAIAEEQVNTAKLKVEVHEGTLAEKLRNDYFEEHQKAMSNERVSESISRDKLYGILKQTYFKKIKERDLINSAYWALKAKDQKLNDLVKGNMQSGDMEEFFLQNKMNSYNDVEIRKRKG